MTWGSACSIKLSIIDSKGLCPEGINDESLKFVVSRRSRVRPIETPCGVSSLLGVYLSRLITQAPQDDGGVRLFTLARRAPLPVVYFLFYGCFQPSSSGGSAPSLAFSRLFGPAPPLSFKSQIPLQKGHTLIQVINHPRGKLRIIAKLQ